MISIKMYNEKWQIKIGDEIWEFENVEEMKNVLTSLISMKDKYGKINYHKGCDC